jgi:putative permease
MDIKNIKFPFYARLAYILIACICLSYIAVIGKQLLSPLIFSFLIANLLLPVSNFLEDKLKFPRAIAAIVCVLIFISIIVAILYLLGSEITNLASDWPQLKQQIYTTIANMQDWVEQTFHINAAKQTRYVNTQTGKILSPNTAVLGSTFLSISSTLLFFIFIFLYTFFILLKRRLLVAFLISVFDNAHTKIVYDVIDQIKYIIKKYIVGLVLEMFIVSLMTFLILSIIGIKYALLLGLLTGILNIIPYIGILSALVFSLVITLATGAGSQILWVAASLFGVHLIDANILMPIVVGSKVKINALIVVLGIVIGEMLWGIAGMFLAIPLIAITKIIFDRVEGLKPWGLLLGEEEVGDKSTNEVILDLEKKK